MNLPKFCKDCKHFKELPGNPGKPKCWHPEALLGHDLVFGYPSYATCEYMRTEGPCKRQAYLFDPKAL